MLEVRVTGRRGGSHQHYELTEVHHGISIGIQFLGKFVHDLLVPSALQEVWQLLQEHLHLPLFGLCAVPSAPTYGAKTSMIKAMAISSHDMVLAVGSRPLGWLGWLVWLRKRTKFF